MSEKAALTIYVSHLVNKYNHPGKDLLKIQKYLKQLKTKFGDKVLLTNCGNLSDVVFVPITLSMLKVVDGAYDYASFVNDYLKDVTSEKIVFIRFNGENFKDFQDYTTVVVNQISSEGFIDKVKNPELKNDFG
jgi:hypothetical protein